MGRSKRSAVRETHRPRPCGLEPLESRLLLAAAPSPFSRVIPFTGQSHGGGTHPNSLVMDLSGNTFGTTLTGGLHNYGTLFEIAAGTTTLLPLASFTGGIHGFEPSGNLVLENGNLYGATTSGGTFNRGTLFQLNLTTHALTTLASFAGGKAGAYPTSGIASDGNGNLYGTTFGTEKQASSLFTFNLSTGTLQTLVSFPLGQRSDTGVAVDAATGLVKIANEATINGVTTGTIFTTITNGGSGAHGNIVSFNLGAGATTTHTVASFDGTHGSSPIGSLLYVTHADSAGDPGLVGMTTSGGAKGVGVIFDALLIQTNGVYSSTLTSLGSFSGATGARPLGHLLLVDSLNAATDSLLGNTLYGVTAIGGGNGNGAVFKITNAAQTTPSALIPGFTHSAFTKLSGKNPSGGLVISVSGSLLVTTATQGPFLDGTVVILPTAEA